MMMIMMVMMMTMMMMMMMARMMMIMMMMIMIMTMMKTAIINIFVWTEAEDTRNSATSSGSSVGELVTAEGETEERQKRDRRERLTDRTQIRLGKARQEIREMHLERSKRMDRSL